MCESRVLLSAVTAADDPTTYASMPDDMYDSPDYFDAATDGPLGDDLAGYEDEYSDYQDSWYDSLDENYDEATDSQDEYADSTSQDGEDQSDSSDDSDTEQTDTSEETDTGGYQSLIGQLIGGLSGGSVSEDDGTDSGTDDQGGTNEDDSTESNETEVAEVSPFDVPDYIQFAQADLPLQSQTDDLFQVTPSGTESFNTETVSSSTATQQLASDESTAAPLTADLNQTVVVQQDWNSDTDWTVHQSRTNTFQQDSVNGDQDEVVPERTGTETYSITVINGTTTVETHSITSSIRLAEGTIPGDEAGEDTDSEGNDPFAIPESWVTASSTPVSTSSDTDATEESGDGDDADDTADTQSEFGSFTSYNTGLTTTTTTTQIVLDDGTAAIQQTITMSWYAGFTWRTGGDIGNDLLGDDASTDVPEGTTVDISGNFKVFASASIGGHFSVTTVTAVSDNSILADEGFISAGFAVTAMAGGSMTFTTEIGRDESSGSVADGTDTKDFAKLKDTQSSAGRVGLSFWMAGSTADDEASTIDDSESQTESTQGSVQPDTDDAPKVGQQSAEEMLSENKSGVQLNFEIEGSSGSSKDHTIESKIRHDEYNTETFSHTDISSSDNNMSFAFAAGTEEISISVGAGGSSSTNTVASYEYRSTGNNGENTSEGVDDETLIVFDKDDYTEVTSSEWSFLFSLGTGDGFQLENTSSFDVSVSSVQDQGDIFNGDKAGYRWEHVYVDYSEDKEPENPDEPLPERKNLKTAVFYDSTGIYEAEAPIIGEVSGSTSDSDSSGTDPDSAQMQDETEAEEEVDADAAKELENAIQAILDSIGFSNKYEAMVENMLAYDNPGGGGGCDCDDVADFMQRILLREINNIRVSIVVAKWLYPESPSNLVSGRAMGHAMLMVERGGRYWLVNATRNDIEGPFLNVEDFWCNLYRYTGEEYGADPGEEIGLSGPFGAHAELGDGAPWYESQEMSQRVADWFRKMKLDPETAFPDGVEAPSPLPPPFSWWSILSHVSESFRYVPPF